jgi:hypothetical protein
MKLNTCTGSNYCPNTGKIPKLLRFQAMIPPGETMMDFPGSIPTSGRKIIDGS